MFFSGFSKFIFANFLVLSLYGYGQSREETNKTIIKAVDALNKKEHVNSLLLLNNVKNIANKNQWYKEEFLAVNNIAANYFLMLDYGEALDHYLEAYKLAIRHLDHTSEMIVLNNIAILYSKEKRFKKAEDYFNKAYEIAVKFKDNDKIAMYAINLAIANIENNQPDKAYNYIEIAKKHRKRKNLDITIQATYIDYLILKDKNELAKTEN